MAITTEAYRQLKREVNEARTEAEQAKGALNQLMEQLEAEFGCKTLKEAKEHLIDLEKKRDAAQAKFDKAFTEYERNWKANDT